MSHPNRIVNTFVVLVLMLGLFLPTTRVDAAGTISLSALGSAYTQNFDTLASSGTSSAVPTGWHFFESGTNANAIFTAGTGSSGTGDTYSFGTSGDRAFGGLLSGTLVPTIGAQFVNNTGAPVNSLTVSYWGEEWRLGTAGRTDKLEFQLSTNATSLTSGTWAAYSGLDFSTPSTTTVGTKNGNLSANRTAVTSTITGLSIPDGATFWIRWTDVDATGADDGLAVDDFSITPYTDALGLISLTTLGSAYTQNFDTLASSGDSIAVPTGWGFFESGTNANTTYTAGNGGSNTGNTYSFGPSGDIDRAFGGLLSNTLVPTIGAQFVNNTGVPINFLTVSYIGEQWRFGSTGRGADKLEFQLSTNATSLTTGTWAPYTGLDFYTPNTTTAVGPKDGNSSANRTLLTSTITGLSIPDGATFWIRWTDFDATGADDGLAVDDFSLIPDGALQLLAIKSVVDENGGNLIPGDILLYTVVMQNQSGYTVNGLEFTDSIPAYTTYMAGSVIAPAGSSVVSQTPVLDITGINVPAHGEVTLSFRVTVEDPLPAGVSQVSNQGTVNYDSNGDGTNDSTQQTDGDTTLSGNQATRIKIVNIQTTIVSQPEKQTYSTTATFNFTGSAGPYSYIFECKLDNGSWTQCSSPKTYSSLSIGNHLFQVRTVDENGTRGPSPATYSWDILPFQANSGTVNTGFAPSTVTLLPLQTVRYSELDDLWLEIPSLGLEMQILGVPRSGDGNWDVSWLGSDAGWLEGSVFPTYSGNAVLTGHVVDSYGQPGPFNHIYQLRYDNKIIVHAWGTQYIYKVREVLQVEPDDISIMFKHEERPWLSLITCRGYDELTGTYKYRVLVRAVLVDGE